MTLLLSVFDLLERLSMNFYVYSQQRYIMKNRGKLFEASVINLFLYGSGKWPVSTEDLSHIKTSDHAMV